MMRFLKPYWKATVLAIFMLMAVVTADLIIPRLVQRIVDEGIVPGDMTIVINTTLIILGVSLISALMALCNTLLSVRVAQNFAADLRGEVFRKIQTFSFGNLDRLQTGQLMIRMTSDISQEQQIVLMSMRMLTRGPVMFLGCH
jgi:ATP-binding cassette subfamily B protein